MPNQITVTFIPCEPAPANGYRLYWREGGSLGAYTYEGIFTESPIIFIDDAGIEGECYEGFLQSDCSESGESGDFVGTAIPWTTCTTPCKTITMHKISGSPTVHYRACDGSVHDGVIVPAEGVTICTDGSGITISGGGIVIDSEVEGDC